MGSIRSIAVGEEEEVFFGNYFWNWLGLLLNRVIPFSCPRVVSHSFGIVHGGIKVNLNWVSILFYFGCFVVGVSVQLQ